MTTVRELCKCGGEYGVIHQSWRASTVRCKRCGDCAVGVELQLVLPLRRFHQRLEDGHCFRPLDDIKFAEDFWLTIAMDRWPSPAQAVDFGIENESHFRGMRFAIESGVSAYVFDRVMGDGPAITSLVASLPRSPFRQTVFETPWDPEFDLAKRVDARSKEET
jgi:hypothetical protein